MNTRLMVLGLLRDKSQSGYDLHKWFELGRTELWAGVLPGSIYHALHQMQKEELVEVSKTELVGNRSRAIYTITPTGRTTFEQLVLDAWQIPPHSFPEDLYALLTFSDHLPSDFLLDAIQRQVETLEYELKELQVGETRKTELGVLPRWGKAMFKNQESHVTADLQLLRSIAESLANHSED